MNFHQYSYGITCVKLPNKTKTQLEVIWAQTENKHSNIARNTKTGPVTEMIEAQNHFVERLKPIFLGFEVMGSNPVPTI